jgi:hypothetical protein
MVENASMPTQIKYFWCISIVLALLWSGFAVFDTFVALSAANQALHPTAYRVIELVHLAYTVVIWGGIVIFSGWLVSVRRKSWARYLFIGVVLVRIAIPVLTSAYYSGLNAVVPALLQLIRFEWRIYVTILLLITGSLFAFSPAARRWLSAKAA